MHASTENQKQISTLLMCKTKIGICCWHFDTSSLIPFFKIWMSCVPWITLKTRKYFSYLDIFAITNYNIKLWAQPCTKKHTILPHQLIDNFEIFCFKKFKRRRKNPSLSAVIDFHLDVSNYSANKSPADVLLKNNNPLPMIGRAGGPSIFNDK